MAVKAKGNPRKYTPAVVAQITNELRKKVLKAEAERRWIWNVDEVHFALSDHQRFAWALPNENPWIPQTPQKGMQSCSVIAAACAQTGQILFDLQAQFQKQEDVIPFISRICCETPLNRKVAILWDNASAHKARTVKAHLARLDVASIFNIAYSPQYNGIEHVFSDVKPRFR